MKSKRKPPEGRDHPSSETVSEEARTNHSNTNSSHGADINRLCHGTRPLNGQERKLGKGLVNGAGLVNGKGFVNGRSGHRGPVNGTGLVNGNGLINGTKSFRSTAISEGRGLINSNSGLVNGNGLVNGIGFANGSRPFGALNLRGDRAGVVTQKEIKFFVAFLCIILILGPLGSFLLGYIAPVPPTPSGIVINGDFSDWEDVQKYKEDLPATGTIPTAMPVEYATDLSEGMLSVYLKTWGTLFAVSEPDMYEIFVDSDGDVSTGYRASSDIGSEYRIELVGWNGSLQSSVLSEFKGSDRLNFSAWHAISGVGAAIRRNELETQIDSDALEIGDGFKVSIHAKDSLGTELETSVTPSRTYGSLLVTQSPAPQYSSGAPIVSGSQDVVELTFAAKGTDVNVEDVEVRASGGILADIEPFSVAKDTTAVRLVNLDASGLSARTLVDINLESVRADRPVRILGRETRVYVDSSPPNITIDGLFNDWNSASLKISKDTTGGINANVDIERYSSAKDSESAYFYLDMAGKMLEGSFLPMNFKIPRPQGTPGTPGPVTPPTAVYVPRVSGEDFTRIFIDTNTSDNSGIAVEGISADHMIEIRGIHGAITSKNVYKWVWPAWVRESAEPNAEIDDARMEVGIPLAILGELNATNLVFMTTDWSGSFDWSEIHWGLDPDAEATKGGNGGMIPLHGNNARTAYSEELANTPTVDGNCTTVEGEYDGAYVISGADFNIYIGHVLGTAGGDTDYLYVCIVAGFDGTEDTFDYASLYFDTSHDGGDIPRPDDRNFTIYRNPAGAWLFMKMRGTNNPGNPWASCPGCDATAQAADQGSALHYEFKVSFDDVWGMQDPQANRVAGFGIIVYDNASKKLFKWGSSNFVGDKPNTWGHIQYLPEFQEMLIPIAAVVVVSSVVLRWRKPRKSRGKHGRSRKPNR